MLDWDEVTCPVCDAEPAEMCWVPSFMDGFPVQNGVVHQERQDAADLYEQEVPC